MSNQPILATYTNGVFRLVDPKSIQLSEGQSVELGVKQIDHATYILELARQVYAGLTEEEILAIEEEMRRRP